MRELNAVARIVIAWTNGVLVTHYLLISRKLLAACSTKLKFILMH